MRRLLTCALIAAACWTAPMPVAAAATLYPAESNLGGVDLDGYCRHKGYQGTKLVNNTGYGWTCYKGSSYVAISMTDVCHWTYGKRAIDRMGDYNDVMSWRCWG